MRVIVNVAGLDELRRRLDRVNSLSYDLSLAVEYLDSTVKGLYVEMKDREPGTDKQAKITGQTSQ